MNLSQDEIEDLYAFTRLHFVEHYDLQTELVDHMSNDIESVWIKQPKLPYIEVRDKAFKKFGIFGFMDVVSKRQKAMGKRYHKYLWKELKRWFTLPKLVITLSIGLGFYILLSSTFATYVIIASYSIIAVWSLYKSFQLKRQFKNRKKVSKKKWMLEEMIFKQAGVSAILLISQLPSAHRLSDTLLLSPTMIGVLSMFTTLIILWMYISFEILPNKAEELLDETYPEFSL